jgi:hypothetical protein
MAVASQHFLGDGADSIMIAGAITAIPHQVISPIRPLNITTNAQSKTVIASRSTLEVSVVRIMCDGVSMVMLRQVQKPALLGSKGTLTIRVPTV